MPDIVKSPIKVALRDRIAKATLNEAVRGLKELGLPLSECLLGGGTAIDARRHHRQSKDIDLSTTTEAYQRLLQDLGPEGIRKALEKAGGHQIIVHDIGTIWKVRVGLEHKEHGFQMVYGEASLFARDLPEGAEPGPEAESVHGILLAPTWTILQGKVRGRIIETGRLLPRDVHDLLVCAREEPESLARAMAGADPLALRAAASTIRNEIAADPSWNGDGASDRDHSIIEPRHANLTGPRLWLETARLLEEGPEAYIRGTAPVPRRSRQPER